MDIAVTTILLFAVFGILLFVGCPISVSIVVSSIVTALSSLSWDQITFITMQKMNGGVESFSLLAVPLFILAGNIMNNGGIARRLVNFAKLFCGWIPGSLAQANVLGNMLFGALSGSAVAASSAMSWVMAYSGIPAAISSGLMSITDNKYILLLLMNIILLIVGMFMDITPAILIFTPIFLPIAESLGMSSIQFGVMLIFNMCMGSMTPPVGSVLFVSCGISKITIEQVTKTLLPYFAVLLGILLAVTYVPALSMGIPTLLGLV